METSFMSFFLVKLEQIHIDKCITAGYSTNILQCQEYQAKMITINAELTENFMAELLLVVITTNSNIRSKRSWFKPH